MDQSFGHVVMAHVIWRHRESPPFYSLGRTVDRGPGRRPSSISAWRTHLRTVSLVPTPSNFDTARIAAHSVSYCPRTSATIRTARSRSSGGYLLDEFADMTPSFPKSGVSGHAGAVTPLIIQTVSADVRRL